MKYLIIALLLIPLTGCTIKHEHTVNHSWKRQKQEEDTSKKQHRLRPSDHSKGH